MNNYNSENVFCEAQSEADPEDCEALIDKVVGKIDAKEGSFGITFKDNSTLLLKGWSYAESALEVEIELTSEN